MRVTKALSGHNRATLLRRGGLFLAMIVIALFAQLRPAGSAFADTDHYCSAGQSLSSYQTNHCVYASGSYLSHSGGQWLQVNVYINLNATPTIPSNVVTDIDSALSNWTGSQAHVVVTRVYGTNYSNLVEVVPDSCGFTNSNGVCDFQNDGTCGGIWGDTTDYVTPHTIMLNEYRFSCTGTANDATWTNIAAHELGHAMGLDHNTNCSPQCQLMAYTPHVSTPQSIDVSIFNTVYPNAPCPIAPGDYNCNNQDYKQQGCNSYAQGGAYSTTLITVTLYYSTNCQSNWTLATVHDTADYTLYKVDIERQSGYSPTSLLEYPTYDSWYTNMLWAPNFSARGCAWYMSVLTGKVYGPVCSSWV